MSSSPIDDIENRIIEDDDNDFRKVTLSEKHIPDKNGFKVCGVCGMRLYRGDLATRKKIIEIVFIAEALSGISRLNKRIVRS